MYLKLFQRIAFRSKTVTCTWYCYGDWLFVLTFDRL